MKFQHLLKVRAKKENLIQFMDGRTIVLSVDAVKLSKARYMRLCKDITEIKGKLLINTFVHISDVATRYNWCYL
jgi:hypothetical protein